MPAQRPKAMRIHGFVTGFGACWLHAPSLCTDAAAAHTFTAKATARAGAITSSHSHSFIAKSFPST